MTQQGYRSASCCLEFHHPNPSGLWVDSEVATSAILVMLAWPAWLWFAGRQQWDGSVVKIRPPNQQEQI